MTDGFSFDWKSRELKRVKKWKVERVYFDPEFGRNVTRYAPAYAQTQDLILEDIADE